MVVLGALHHTPALSRRWTWAADPGWNPLLYNLAFVIATGLLHLLGILPGETRRWPGGRRFVQGAGGVVALVGLWFLELVLT